MITQVYGLTTVGDATACVRLGVDNLGVVLDEGLGAWDAVELDTARAILDAVGDATPRLALSLGTDPATVLATAQVTDPDILHVARAVAFTPATLEAIRADLDPVALMCTIPVVSGDAPTIAVRYETVADYLLLDSMDQGSGVVGATGLIHDWTVSARVVAAVEVPVVLAGGLGPENVGEASRSCTRGVSTRRPARVAPTIGAAKTLSGSRRSSPRLRAAERRSPRDARRLSRPRGEPSVRAGRWGRRSGPQPGGARRRGGLGRARSRA